MIRYRNASRWMASVALCLMSLFVVSGCDDGRPKRVKVSGRVLIDGEPVTLGIVQLVPDGTRPAAGKIGPDGRFELSSFDGGDGVVLGTHRAMVSAQEIISESKVRWHAPPKYSDFRDSGLTIEITEPTDDLSIDLTWDGGKPFVK